MDEKERPFSRDLEVAYWRFDARRKGYEDWKGHPQSERDAFKQELAEAVNAAVSRAVEAERDGCAKIADQRRSLLTVHQDFLCAVVAKDLAEDIRARGKK